MDGNVDTDLFWGINKSPHSLLEDYITSITTWFVTVHTDTKDTVLCAVLPSQIMDGAHVGGSCVEAGVEEVAWQLQAQRYKPQQPTNTISASASAVYGLSGVLYAIRVIMKGNYMFQPLTPTSAGPPPETFLYCHLKRSTLPHKSWWNQIQRMQQHLQVRLHRPSTSFPPGCYAVHGMIVLSHCRSESW